MGITFSRGGREVWLHATNSDDYASFAAAISTIGATETTLVISSQEAVTADVTVPATLELKFLRGGSLTISSTKTVTINGHIDAGLYQIFEGAGSVSFGGGAVKEVYPQWWGAVGDGVTDDTAEIQAAINAYKRVFFPESSIYYKISSALSVSTNNSQLIGANWASRICNFGSGAAIILNGCNHVIIDTLAVLGDGGAYGAGASGTYGIELVDATHITLENVNINYHGSHGIYCHGGVWCISVIGCKIQQNFGDGINSVTPNSGEQNGNNFSVENSAIFSNTGNGIQWKAAGFNLSGTCIETNKGVGFLSDCTGTTTSAYSLNIAGNYFESNWLGQIKLITATGYVIYGCSIHGNYLKSSHDAPGGATALIVASGGTGLIRSMDIGPNAYEKSGATLTHWVDLGNVAHEACFIDGQGNSGIHFTNCLYAVTKTGIQIKEDTGNPVKHFPGMMCINTYDNTIKMYAESAWRTINANYLLGDDLAGSATWDPGSIANGAEEMKEVTVTGAALGDFAIASFSLDVADLVLNAQVTAANTITAVLSNNTGGAIDLGSGTLYVKVIKR